MRFGPKPARGTPAEGKFFYPLEVKQRAFQLYVLVDDKLERKHTAEEVTKILNAEFPDIPQLRNDIVYKWAQAYSWHKIVKSMIQRAAAAASADAATSSLEYYNVLAERASPDFTFVKKMNKLVENQRQYVDLADEIAPVVAAYVTEMFILNKEHFNALMEKSNDRFVYDVGKDGERKQYWDMYLAGVTKMLEIHGFVTKKMSTKAVMTDQFGNKKEISLETEETVSPDINDPKVLLALMQMKTLLEQKGAVNALPGPDNSDFPSEQGDPNFIPGSTEGADSKS